MSVAKNMSNDIGKNISKSLSSKYKQKLRHITGRSATDAPKCFPKKRN